MSYYISGDSITNNISTIQFFPKDYYNEYIKNFIDNNNLVESLENNKTTPLIFITKVVYLDNFYNQIVKHLNNKFVLITHYGDDESGLNENILNHPLLIKWYGQNMKVKSNKTHGLPIGLCNELWGYTNFNILKKYSSNPKEKLLYLNFSISIKDRTNILNNLIKKGFTKNKKYETSNWDKYIKDLSTHKFCISPKGMGADCHRTWECLYLGVIPIVEKSTEMSFFEDLPILFVDSYDEISVEFLNQTYKNFQNKSFNLDKLSINYWTNKIKNHFI